MGDQVNDDFAVRAGLEDGAIGFQLVPQHLSIDEIAVMGEGQISKGKIDRKRLDVLEIVPPAVE